MKKINNRQFQSQHQLKIENILYVISKDKMQTKEEEKKEMMKDKKYPLSLHYVEPKKFTKEERRKRLQDFLNSTRKN